jgi:hypothetical protein
MQREKGKYDYLIYVTQLMSKCLIYDLGDLYYNLGLTKIDKNIRDVD